MAAKRLTAAPKAAEKRKAASPRNRPRRYDL